MCKTLKFAKSLRDKNLHLSGPLNCKMFSVTSIPFTFHKMSLKELFKYFALLILHFILYKYTKIEVGLWFNLSREYKLFYYL